MSAYIMTYRMKRSHATIALLVFVLISVNVLGFFICPNMAMADPASPDALQILDVEAYRHLIEDDDFLVIFTFNIEYAMAPDDPASDLFIFRMTSGSTTLGDALPYTYGYNGYQYGISGMYFSAADAPSWGSLYDIKIDGNPAEWASPPSVTQTMESTDYSTSSSQSASQNELEVWLIDAFQDLEQNWSVPGELVTITNIGTILTAEGQHYILGAIPGMMLMAPNIFAVKYYDIEYPDTIWTGQRQTDTDARFADTPLEKFQESLSNAMGGIDPVFITSVITVICVLVLMALSYRRWGSTEPVYGLVPMVLLLGAKIDFFPWELYALFIFACAAYAGWILIGKYASG